MARRKRLSNARRLVRLLDERDPQVAGDEDDELLAELVPLLEGHGHDAGDVRAALGG